MRPSPVRVLLLAALVLGAGLPSATAADAPVNVTVVRGEGRLVVEWEDPPVSPDRYRVYRVTPTGDVLLADLNTVWNRHVETGLGAGETRTYRVASVEGGVETSSPPVTGTTFSTSTTNSTFSSGPEGFATEATGGGTVAWSSGAIVVTQTSGGSSADTIFSRALPETWGADTHDFSVEATVRRTQGAHDARFWALALAPAGSGDLATRPGVLGFVVDENTDGGGDGGHGVEFRFRSTNGTLIAVDIAEFCYDCPLAATYKLRVAYDAQERRLNWSMQHVEYDHWRFGSHLVGSRDADLFSVSRLAVATESPPQSGTARHTVDNVVVAWSGADSTPTVPVAPLATRAGPGSVAFSWSEPRSSGTEHVLGYKLQQEGVELGWEFDRSTTLTGVPRWGLVRFTTSAVSEIGRGAAAAANAEPEAGERLGVETFDTEPVGWIEARDSWPSESRVRHFGDRGYLHLANDKVGSARYGVDFDGATWRPTTGSFHVEATYNDTGSGIATGGCPIAILPAGTSSCVGPGIATEFRAENRTSSSPPTMRLRFTDASGAVKLNVVHPVVSGEKWRVNVTYDHVTRDLTLRLRNATGALLASGNVTVASDAFALGFVGVTAGTGSWRSTAQAGSGLVEDFAFGFVAPQPAGIPQRPSSVVAEALNADGRALVTWDPPAGGPAVERYHVYRAHRNGVPVLAGSTTGTSFEDDDLGRRQPYVYRVAAVGSSGEGLPAGRADVVTLDVPSEPRFVRAARTGSPGELRVSWSPPLAYGDTVGAYEVRRGSTLIATLGGDASSFVDVGLSEGVFYVYSVRAANGIGWGPADSDGEYAPTRPTIPSTLVAIQGPTPGIVNLTWGPVFSDGGLAVSEYRVYRDGELVQQSLDRYHNQSGSAEGAQILYEVSAVNALGEGPRAKLTVTVASPADAPFGFSASPGPTLGSVSLAWGAPADDGGLPIAGYRLYRTLANSTTLVGTIKAGTSLTFRDTGLPHATSLSYSIAAVTGVGEGARANVSTTTWANVAPDAVRALNATRSTFANVRVSWEAPLANGGPPVTAYRVYRNGGLGGETLAATVTSGTTFTDSPFTYLDQPAREYVYRVTAVNLVGEGASSWSDAARPLV